MGRRKRSFRSNRDRDRGNKDGNKGESSNSNKRPRPLTEKADWSIANESNELFERYYKSLTQLLPDGEFDQFLACLKTTLPFTFRITGSRGEATDLRNLLKENYFSKLQNQTLLSPPAPLAWFSDDLMWGFNVTKREMKSQPNYAAFHKFLVQETALGNISRQEAVSMLPTFFLDVQQGHLVLDMCAAPGSKTAQLIEAVHGDSIYSGTQFTSGLVIANDADLKRCYVLIHQTQRLLSPCVAVTNHDATSFPTIFLPKEPGSNMPNPLQFDRVLCDVPCSSDGTLRKNPMLWRRWGPMFAIGLHKLQIRILTRGCELLKIGGTIVYSTCSFNPIENEAVVAAMLRAGQGALELVDVSAVLPALKRRPGIKSWQVLTRSGKIVSSFAETDTEDRNNISATMFPPAEDEHFPFERCLRILPHLQDTGGFFVAVFKKTAPFGNVDNLLLKAAARLASNVPEPEASIVDASETVDTVVEPVAAQDPLEESEGKKRGADRYNQPIKDEPYSFMDPNSEDVLNIKKYYGASEHFPSDLLMIRSDGDKAQHIYLVSQALKQLLLAENRIRLRILQTGTRLMARNSDPTALSACTYRLMQDGLAYVQKFLSGRRVAVPPADLFLLLQNHQLISSQLSRETQQNVYDLETNGCFLIVYDPSKYPEVKAYLSQPLILCGWRGKKTTQAMIVKAQRESILSRFLMSLDEFKVADQRIKSSDPGKMEITSSSAAQPGPDENPDENPDADADASADANLAGADDDDDNGDKDGDVKEEEDEEEEEGGGGEEEQ